MDAACDVSPSPTRPASGRGSTPPCPNASRARSRSPGRSRSSQYHGRRQRALLRDARSARRGGRLHHRARDQPDVRRAGRAVVRRSVGPRRAARRRLGRARPGPRHAGRRCAARDGARPGSTPPVHFVETSPVLRAAQAERVPDATWHDAIETLPDRPPADRRRQRILRRAADPPAGPRRGWRGASGWSRARTRCSCRSPASRCPTPSSPSRCATRPPGRCSRPRPRRRDHPRARPRGSPRRAARCSRSITAMKGRRSATRCRRCAATRFANPFEEPGEHDLTAHVDFTTLAAAAQAAGAVAWGPVDAGATWLGALGIDARAAALARAAPDGRSAIAADRDAAGRTRWGRCSRRWR